MSTKQRWAALAVLVAMAIAVVSVILLTPPDRSGVITPGVARTDTAGDILQARGAGIFQVGETFYMVGEDKSAGPTYTAIACYSSTDLVDWTRQDDALSQEPSGDLAAGRVVERPKVLYNDSTGKYVMYVHIDDAEYADARVGVATSDTPCGPYEYLGSSRPLGDQSRDIGLFKDTDGSAYLMTEDRESGLRVVSLSDDYLTPVEELATVRTSESPTMVKVDGTYFMFASNLTGWDTNDNVYFTATDLAGPWTEHPNFAPEGTNTFDSQTSFVLPIDGSETTSYLYMGDRWFENDLNSTLPVWLPMTIEGDAATLPFYESWSIDTGTGVVTGLSGTVVAGGSGRCLDLEVNEDWTDEGAQQEPLAAEVWDCRPIANQQWTETDAGELRSSPGNCLVALGGAVEGAAVGVATCDGGAAQTWSFTGAGTLVADESGLCAERADDDENGTGVVLAACGAGAGQQWEPPVG